jgi:hypothetical protein
LRCAARCYDRLISLAFEAGCIARFHTACQAGETTVRRSLYRIDAYDRRGPHLNSLIHVHANALAKADRLHARPRSTGTLLAQARCNQDSGVRPVLIGGGQAAREDSCGLIG